MRDPAAPADLEYDAFLSYATEADYGLARELEDFLERFHELPTPVELTLRPLSIWRDGSDVALADTAPRGGITSVLENALARCRYLVLLWSVQSRQSSYMEYELDWFLNHRKPGDILLAITDAQDPDPSSGELFLPSMIEAGLTNRPWYDFRGFHKDSLAGARRLRDFDEGRVQLAADLNGYRPADIQPLWWRNKVQEERARAEREERARRRIELAECDARIEAANGWYERAFSAFGTRDYGKACRFLVKALAIADPARVPDHYDRTLERPGWAEPAWAFLRYALALTPRVRHVELATDDKTNETTTTSPVPHLEIPNAAEIAPRSLAWSNSGYDVVLMRGNLLEVYDLRHGTLAATLDARAGAGSLTTWAAARTTDLIVAGTDEGQVTAWSRSTDGLIVASDRHSAAITAVGIAPDGSTAVTGSADGEIRIWPDMAYRDHPERSRIVRDADGQSVTYVALMDGNTSLLFLVGAELLLRDMASGKERVVNGLITKAAVATDEKGVMIAYGDWDVVHRSDVHQPEDAVLYVGEHRGFVDEIVFAADGEHMFTRATGGETYAWAGREHPLERGSSFMGARMTKTFGMANRGSLLKRLNHLGPVDAIATHPKDPERFLITRRGTLREGSLGFAWRPLAAWRPTLRGLRSAVWLPDGRRIVYGADDGSLGVLALDGERPAVALASLGAAIGDVAVSPDGVFTAAVTEDGRVAIHAVEDGHQVATERLSAVPFAVAFAGAEGGNLAVGCQDGIIRLWNWRGDDERPRRLGACDGPVLAIAVNPGGTVLVVGSESGELAAWDIEEGLQLWSTEDTPETQFRFGGPVHDVSLSLDGTVAVGGMMSGAVRVVDMTTGHEFAWIPVRSTVPGKPEHVTAVGVCDDGRTAVVGLWDGTLCVLDLKAERELFRFQAHTKVVTAAAQAPGTGNVLTTSLDDDPANDGVRVWDLLDAETVPTPDAGRPDWPASVRIAVEQRNGVEDAEDTGASPRPAAEPAQIVGLRTALIADPSSPERNLELATALIETGHPSAAQDYIARAHRFGGANLITDPQARGLLAFSLLGDGKVEEALPWLRVAAVEHDPESLMQLGLLCIEGRIAGGTEAEGVDCLRQSAELGHAGAAYNLGVYYEHVAAGAVGQTDWQLLAFGESGGEDAHAAEAVRWYTIAADQDYEPAEEALERLTGSS